MRGNPQAPRGYLGDRCRPRRPRDLRLLAPRRAASRARRAGRSDRKRLAPTLRPAAFAHDQDVFQPAHDAVAESRTALSCPEAGDRLPAGIRGRASHRASPRRQRACREAQRRPLHRRDEHRHDDTAHRRHRHGLQRGAEAAVDSRDGRFRGPCDPRQRLQGCRALRGKTHAGRRLRQFGCGDRAGFGRARGGRRHGGARSGACHPTRPVRTPHAAHQHPPVAPAAEAARCHCCEHHPPRGGGPVPLGDRAAGGRSQSHDRRARAVFPSWMSAPSPSSRAESACCPPCRKSSTDGARFAAGFPASVRGHHFRDRLYAGFWTR